MPTLAPVVMPSDSFGSLSEGAAEAVGLPCASACGCDAAGPAAAVPGAVLGVGMGVEEEEVFEVDDDEAVDDAVREPVTVEGAASRNFFARMTTPRFESGLQQFVLVPQHQRSEELVPSQGVIVLNPLSYTFSNQQPCL